MAMIMVCLNYFLILFLTVVYTVCTFQLLFYTLDNVRCVQFMVYLFVCMCILPLLFPLNNDNCPIFIVHDSMSGEKDNNLLKYFCLTAISYSNKSNYEYRVFCSILNMDIYITLVFNICSVFTLYSFVWLSFLFLACPYHRIFHFIFYILFVFTKWWIMILVLVNNLIISIYVYANTNIRSIYLPLLRFRLHC